MNIQKLLSISPSHTIKTGFLRENLRFEVVKGMDKRTFLKNYLKNQESEAAGIIYASTRKEVEEICEWLNHNHFKSVRYHAGLSEQERQINQELFLLHSFAFPLFSLSFLIRCMLAVEVSQQSFYL